MPTFTTFPLIRQLLRPLIALLLILAGTSILGSTFLLYTSLSSAVDAQLDHSQQMVYHELKQRELQLEGLLSDLGRKSSGTPLATLERELRTHQPQLSLSLSDDHSALSPSQRKIVDEVLQSRSGVRRVTFDHEKNSYNLTFVEPAAAPHNVLLLQYPIDRRLLKQLHDRYICNFALYTEDGKLIASSSDRDFFETQLPPNRLARIAGSYHLYTSKTEDVDYRRLFAPLPLGSDGMLYLAASHSLDKLNGLLLTHSFRLLLTVILAMAIGAVVYYRLLQRTLKPLKILLETIRQVAQGNLAARVEVASDSQLHELGTSFNLMLGQLETLYQNRLEAEKTAVLTQETLKYNSHLKKKNLEIEKVNIQLKEQYEELSALFQVSRSLTSSLDQNLLFEKIFGVFRDSLHCDRVVLLLYQPGTETLEAIKTTGLDAVTVKGLSFRLGEGISGTVASTMQLIYSPDLSVDNRNLSYKGRWVSSGSLLSMPMVLQNRLIGVLNIHHQKVDAFNQLARQMAQAIADQAAISIENARLYEKTRTLSATDDLTGLANRRQFQDFLQREWAQSRRYHNVFSLLMLDIDHFKAYNDSHGHLKGDIALKKVAALLLQNTRGIDMVARFGGEEFVLLLPKSDKAGSLAVAEKLCRCIEAEYFSGMEESQPLKKLTVSVGAASFPTDSTDVYELLNLADAALYQAKRNGRNCAVCWSREMTQVDTEIKLECQPSSPPASV